MDKAQEKALTWKVERFRIWPDVGAGELCPAVTRGLCLAQSWEGLKK